MIWSYSHCDELSFNSRHWVHRNNVTILILYYNLKKIKHLTGNTNCENKIKSIIKIIQLTFKSQILNEKKSK